MLRSKGRGKNENKTNLKEEENEKVSTCFLLDQDDDVMISRIRETTSAKYIWRAIHSLLEFSSRNSSNKAETCLSFSNLY